ncbi:MAG TPA: hypothetical protein VLW75_11275 [Rhizomicrobium sp.]|nr:hypothetical protein [Rhizomicrobium sp.]
MKRVVCVFALGLLAAACAAPQTAPTINAIPPAPPKGEPSDLTGMAPSALRVAFGAPAFVRKDGAAQMWRYDGASCKAFFFLYRDGDDFAVRHVETIPRGEKEAADPDCLKSLRVSPPPVS